MATVTSYTKTEIDTITDPLVETGAIDGSGNLTLTTRDATVINVGSIPQIDATSSDIAPLGTRAAGVSTKSAAADHVHADQAVKLSASGLTGATAASRYVGAVASGHPSSGTFAVGDYTIDQTGSIWVCTGAGTPGTWVQVTAFTGGTLTKDLAPAVSALTGSSTTAVNAALGNVFTLTLTASTWTISNPTNSVDGQVIRIRLTQDGTGSRTIAWGTAFDWGSGGSAPTLTTTASKCDVLGFEYNSALSKWMYLGAAFPQGF